MESLFGIAVMIAIAAVLAVVRVARARRRPPEPAPASGTRLYALSSEIEPFYTASAHPADLLAHEPFQRGVALLREPGFGPDDLAGYFVGDNAIIACLAAEALRQRGDGGAPADRVLGAIGSVAAWSLYFGTRYLAECVPAERPIAGRVLARTTSYVEHHRLSREFLLEFIAERARRGEHLAFGDELSRLSRDELEQLDGFLRGSSSEPARTLLAELERWRRERIDAAWLGSVGAVWSPDDVVGGDVIPHPSLDEDVETILAELVASPRRSALLVGELGVGKTRRAQAVARRLQERGWWIFQAGATELVAGQSYHGQFEQRMQDVLRQLRGQRILWIVPDFHALADSGRHQYSGTSALDLLLPHIESGEVAVLGECRPGPFEKLALARPRINTALRVWRVASTGTEETLELARAWWDRHADPADRDAVIHEAWELARQYLGLRAAPGSLLHLLEITWKRLASSAEGGRATIVADDVLVTLSAITGLPPQVLDARQGLDLDALRHRFGERVVGQPEAVECLVDRVAMVKAGLTDPTRPFGVFLFAGPTGTGKTEIAKCLASFLFGSPDRMIRLDMSELQSPDDLERIVGGDTRVEGRQALVDLIREQPFSVVLLDEFEKAHPRSWDLFLQVFDDGRLTDRRGQLADFRYSIVILTSNLGALVPSGERLGFAEGADVFSSGSVVRAVERAFRPEFLNRLDRVVVFRPLDRESMRSILRQELERVLQRRGLRARPWAVEWDPAAIEFLLDEGFSPSLGARPLKRAIERHLLAPLARTLVAHEVPTGDQFLYITVRDRALDVQFIDPEEGEAETAPPEAEGLDLAAVAREARGARTELELLERCFGGLQQVVSGEAWLERKQTALELTGMPDFWRSADRFEILGQYEYQGRIEAGLRRIGSLLERLRSGQRDRLPSALVASVAQTLMLVETAVEDVERGRPQAAFLEVSGELDAEPAGADADGFARRVGAMYLAWAAARRMHVDRLEERVSGPPDGYRLLLSVSGYGAYSILENEDGLHLLESPSVTSRGFHRDRARVRVVPQEGHPGDGGREALWRLAEAALGGSGAAEPRIVRRYRAEPSPLVRDAVRGWRTGRLDRVLAGDFDLMGR